MTAELFVPFRIAIRSDDEWVTAWWAHLDTMEGAIEIGRISKRVAYDAAVADAWYAMWNAACVAAAELAIEQGKAVKRDIRSPIGVRHEEPPERPA